MSTRPAPQKILILTVPFLALLLCCDDVFSFYENKGHSVSQEIYNKNGVFVSKPNDSDLRVHELLLVNRIRSIDEYLCWLKRSVTYKRDEPNDVWSPPEDVLDRRFGDCDDYAFLTASVLGVMGYDAQVLCVDTGRSQHAICIYKDRGVFGWIDQAKLNRTGERSWKRMARILLSRYSARRLILLQRQPRSAKILVA